VEKDQHYIPCITITLKRNQMDFCRFDCSPT
jgi:hypothetical protein